MQKKLILLAFVSALSSSAFAYELEHGLRIETWTNSDGTTSYGALTNTEGNEADTTGIDISGWFKANPDVKPTMISLATTGQNNDYNESDGTLEYSVTSSLTADQLVLFKIQHSAAANRNVRSNTFNGTFAGANTIVGSEQEHLELTLESAQWVDSTAKLEAMPKNTHNLKFRDGALIYADLTNPNDQPDESTQYGSNDTDNQTKEFIQYGNNVVDVEVDNAVWVGAVHTNIREGDKTSVSLMKSCWTVTGNSEVDKLTADDTSTIVVRDGRTSLTLAQDGMTSPILSVKEFTGNTFNLRLETLSEGAVSVDGFSAESTELNITVDGSLNDSINTDELINRTTQALDFKQTGMASQIIFEEGIFTNEVIATGKLEQEGFTTQTLTTRLNENAAKISETTVLSAIQWRDEANDLMKRLGDLRTSPGETGLWGRTYGGKSETSRVENQFTSLQLGVDREVQASAARVWVGGAVSYTDGDATFSQGKGSNRSLAMTLYSSVLFEKGSFLDLSMKFGTLRNSFELPVVSGRFDTQALSISAEIGHRFSLVERVFVEPQIEATFSHVFGENYGVKTSSGVGRIDQDSVTSTVLRAGFVSGLECPNGMGNVYVRASYNYDLDGKTSTNFYLSGVRQNTIDNDLGGGWYELGLGANVNFTERLKGYFDVEFTSGGEVDMPYRWNAGVRYVF